MKAYVYLLISFKDQETYLGSTNDLGRRISEHNSGKCKSTKQRGPLKLIYSEEYDNIEDARVREKYLKTKNGRKELSNIFN